MTGPVIVCVDGSEVGWLAVDRAIEQAQSDGAAVVCVTVAPPRLQRGKSAHFDPEPEALDIEFAAAVLDQATRICRQAGVDVEAVRRVGRPVSALAEEAAQRSASCVVIGRRPQLPGLALPDLTLQLRDAAHCEVIIVDLPERPLPRPSGPA